MRFRLLNGSNARVYRLAFGDGRIFRQIATDTALTEAPISLTTLTLSPGERAEIVVDFSADLGNNLTMFDTSSGSTLLTLAVDQAPARVTTLPTTLTTLDWLDPAAAVRTRFFTLSMGMGMSFQINGVTMDMARIDQTIPLNEVEIWEIRNADQNGMVHSFHLHATHFAILERNGSRANVPSYEMGYQDTILLNSGEVVKIIVRMTDYTTDASAPYMFHCHILEHEDRGMMGQFIVI